MQLIVFLSNEKSRIMSGLSILKNSSFIILVGLAMTLVAFLVLWRGGLIIVTKTGDYLSETIEVSPEGYSFRVIPFRIGWNTHFSFTVEGADIKYILLDPHESVIWERKGLLPHDWTEASSDFSYWEDGISEIMVRGKRYLFYNEDPQLKTVHFESFMSEYSFYARARRNYFFINGGFLLLILGAGIFLSGLCKRLPASMNPRLAFAISGISYLSVLLISYLLPLFYPYLTLYCWFLIPLVANFFVGYFAEDLHTAVKLVISFLFLHIGMVIGLLGVPLFYDGFSQGFTADDPFPLIVVVILTYSIVNITLGVTITCLGTMVRNHIRGLKKLLFLNEK
jgi:hypothetical protein